MAEAPLTCSDDVPDASTATGITALAGEVERCDGAPPLSDRALTKLRSAGVDHLVARREGALVGYAQRDTGVVEASGAPDAIELMLDRLGAPGTSVWSHGVRSRLVPILAARRYLRTRELLQLRMPLRPDAVPADPGLDPQLTVRGFEPGRDEQAWLALNALAFAHHPEQGAWTGADLGARLAEPWFDPDGFLLAERGGELLGFHWTKVHPDGLGEVYVLGVSPAAQGLGLGRALLVRGLRYLVGRGCREVLLYVEGDNAPARHLYEQAGFTRYDVDVQWRAPG